MTAQELINGALIQIGVIASGETPSTDESNDAFARLNNLLASWSAQALPIYRIARETVPLTGVASYAMPSGRPVKIKAASILTTAQTELPVKIVTAAEWAAYQDKEGTSGFAETLWYEDGIPLGKIHLAPKSSGSLRILSNKHVGTGLAPIRDVFTLTGAANYTIGPGGTINVDRPAEITGASILAGSSTSKNVRLVSAEDWAAYPNKGTGGNFAEVGWYDGGYPTATIWLAPTPATGGTLELFNYKPLTMFPALGTLIDLPDGYERALLMNLAVEVAPQYGVPLSQTLIGLANDSKNAIQGLQANVLGVPVPPRQTSAAPVTPA